MNAHSMTPFAAGEPSQGLDEHRVLSAAERAADRIAPLWPLKTFVAVNPFFGLADQRFDQAAETMARLAGARMTMPRHFYLDAISSGRVTSADLTAALAEAPPALAPDSVPALLTAARRRETTRLPVLATVADAATEATDNDWTTFVVDRVASYAAEYFDEGQASWASVAKDDGFYAGWRRVAEVDRTPEIAGVTGFREKVAALPGNADAMLVDGATRLGLAASQLDAYFHRLLMSVGGWTAYARQRVWDDGLYGRANPVLTEFLAVRLAWDLVLFEALGHVPDLAEAWRAALRDPADLDDYRRELTVDCILQTALDKAWQRDLAGRFDAPTPRTEEKRKTVQAAFCIDVRSEVYRRALEARSGDIETIGFAGFFGFPIEYVPLGQDGGGAQCPVLLTPQVTVRETVRDATPEEETAALDLRMVRRRAMKAWKSFKLAAVSSFAFVETLGLTYAAKIATDALGLSRPVPHPSVDGIDKGVQARLRPDIRPGTVGDRATGFTDAARVDMAAAVLTAMSLTKDFARIVLLAGHGSTTVNNPHASGLDCGACGGHTGEANARVAAAILNDPTVRSGLAARGIDVPADTLFVAGLHDTTTDAVHLYDLGDASADHADDLDRLRTWLVEAGKAARAERAALLHLEAGQPVDAQVLARSRDWAQVRPEWGLAGCAAFIAAPRHRTAGLDLGGRSFLHSYDWRMDEDFATLELIMTAPMVVASWISLQYYGSTVDNRVFGSGNKVLHNVVGTLGVLEGNGGDLRVGLPLQSLHDGEKPVHEPLRLTVVIEAPVEAMNDIIARHPMVRDLVDNGWLYLYGLDEDGRMSRRYGGDLRWEPVEVPA